MRKLTLTMALGLFWTTAPFAQEIEYSSSINVSQVKSKLVKHSRCIFSEGYSDLTDGQINSSATGASNNHVETFNFRGTDYLSRKVDWSSDLTKKSITLNFRSGSARFEGSRTYDEHTCTYKTWESASTSALTKLRARAQFLIPANVWAIKVKSNNTDLKGHSIIKLGNKEYDKDGKLTEKAFSEISEGRFGRYFIVNPSADGNENFVFLDFSYTSQTMNANDFELSFEVEFIADEQCLGKLEGLDVAEVMTRDLKKNRYENVLTNMACMLNTSYVRYNLAMLHFAGVDTYFQKLQQVSVNLDVHDPKRTADEQEAVNVTKKLIERVRFYYTYEIAKDTMGLLLNKVEYMGVKVDAWGYLEIMRREGVLDLAGYFQGTERILSQFKGQDGTPFIALSSGDRKALEQLFRFLELSMNGVADHHKKMYRPKHLSAAMFKELDGAAERMKGQWGILQGSLNGAFSEEVLTESSLQVLQEGLRTMAQELRYYGAQIERVRPTKGDGGPADLKTSRQEILKQVETMYRINLGPMIAGLGTYFTRHFEDPVFKDVSINGKTYKDPRDFIADFEQLLKESKK